MPTNLHIDDALLTEAMKLGGFRTKKETVATALTEFIALKKRQALLDAIGTIDFDPSYDYKAERRRHTEKMVRFGIWPKSALHPRKLKGAPARRKATGP
ncbi:MAG: type II toxin-antitoxin system VapB family antitoxin [Thermoanaerobaculia bacterium]|jgi:hypothetical protein|nr:type II toxin-antitoxin system VapB family antitoxin [Thermoanaerobaculia bacterium]